MTTTPPVALPQSERESATAGVPQQGRDRQESMRITVIGLGYVGSVSAACLAQAGHRVLGADPNMAKVSPINDGRSPVTEAGLDELVSAGVAAGRLQATPDTAEAVAQSEISLVCVGTPSRPDGSLDLAGVERACGEIGAGLARRRGYHVVVFRSTVLPGTTRQVILPLLEAASGKTAGREFGLVYNPEFLRESSAILDYHNPPRTVIGEADEISGELAASLYAGIAGPLIRTSYETAEMAKYADNAWHALKVAYGNEIGNLCKALEIDSHEVMEIFCRDTKLNLSPAYLRPGFAFGGSCLPKDLRALLSRSRDLGLETPLLGSILTSNARQVERGVELIAGKGRRRIGVLGLSFKAGTDDLRESPLVSLVAKLLERGLEVRVYDPSLDLGRLTGANLEFVRRELPKIDALLVKNLELVLDHGEVIVVGNSDPEFRTLRARLSPQQIVVDFVRLDSLEHMPGRYDGVNW